MWNVAKETSLNLNKLNKFNNFNKRIICLSFKYSENQSSEYNSISQNRLATRFAKTYAVEIEDTCVSGANISSYSNSSMFILSR